MVLYQRKIILLSIGTAFVRMWWVRMGIGESDGVNDEKV